MVFEFMMRSDHFLTISFAWFPKIELEGCVFLSSSVFVLSLSMYLNIFLITYFSDCSRPRKWGWNVLTLTNAPIIIIVIGFLRFRIHSIAYASSYWLDFELQKSDKYWCICWRQKFSVSFPSTLISEGGCNLIWRRWKAMQVKHVKILFLPSKYLIRIGF